MPLMVFGQWEEDILSMPDTWGASSSGEDPRLPQEDLSSVMGTPGIQRQRLNTPAQMAPS